jgi:N-acetyl-anhydromuramyl-L-alanine amidase AmpD
MEQVSNYCTRHVGGRSDEELSNRLSKLLRSKSTSIATEKKISIIKDEISKRSSMQEETFNGFSVKDGKFTSLWYDHSPNNSDQFQKPIKYIVMHYTANASSVSTRSLFMDDSARGKPSSHFIIGDDLSSTFQVVSLVDIAHHAGISSYGNDKYLNNCSIGIEVVNWGKLTRTESGAFKSWS